MRLKALLQEISLSLPSGRDREIGLVTESTATAGVDSIFVCIRGSRADGHDFAPRAYANGCRIFVSEKALSLPSDAQVLQVENTRAALAMLACAMFSHPSERLHVIGVTGTKGKTTVARMIAHILNQNGLPCGYVGTNGISYGVVTQATQNTTPDAMTLQRTLSDMADAGMKAAVIEVSSQAILQHRVDGTHFETVLFTNLSSDHIGPNEHADFEDYKACKHRLFTDFGARNAIYFAGDSAAQDMIAGTSADRMLLCNIRDAGCDCTATQIRPHRTEEMLGSICTVRFQGAEVRCRLPMPGEYSVANALLALAVATGVFEIPLSTAAKALESIAVEGRMEWIPLPFGATAVIDYAHNGESLRKLLTALRAYAPTRLICLFGSVGERTKLRRRELGSVAAELTDLCILTSDNPGTEEPEQIIAEIARAFEGSSTPYLCIPDRADAIREALRRTQAGDILVLAGKGHETYQLIGTKKLPFCERAIIEAYFQAKQVPELL